MNKTTNAAGVGGELRKGAGIELANVCVLERSDDCATIQKNSNAENKRLVGLAHIGRYLSSAADNQPCPACREDIDILERFIEEKICSLASGKETVGKVERKKLDGVDYVNEAVDIAIFVTNVVGPVTRAISMKAPSTYEKVLHEDMEPNIKVREHLLVARELLEPLKDDGDCLKALKILDSFIKTVEFKLGMDPLAFYVFDKAIRAGYKMHVLGIASRTLAKMKQFGDRMIDA
jgi:hypothetical protein